MRSGRPPYKPNFKAGFYDKYKPIKRDSRVPEARSMLKHRTTLDGLTESSLAATFTLKPETAKQLLEYERQRRGG